MIKNIIRFIIIVALFTLVYKNLKSENYNGLSENYNGLSTQMIPVYCAETSYMFATSTNNFGETPIMVGEIRYGADKTGDMIGLLSFGYNEETNKGSFFMTILESKTTCLIGYGLNWIFFNDTIMGKKILDEGNESKQ
jgi:hypothetical protein